MSRPFHIAGLHSPAVNGVDWWRILLPLRSLEQERGITVEVASSIWGIKRKPDIVLIARNYTLGPQHIAHYRQQDIKIVLDWDDDLLSKRAASLGFDPDMLALGLQNADLVTCTNEQLAKKLHSQNSNVLVIPNLFWPPQWWKLPPRPKDKIVIGVQGGREHSGDWTMLPDLFGRLAAKYPQVHCLIVMPGSALPEWFEPLKVKLGEQLQHHDFAGLSEYQNLVNQIDIGICMLDPGDEFNKYKSPIKWIEHALCGAPCVVSPTVYADYVGNTALIADTPDEWFSHLSCLIENPLQCCKMGQKARENAMRRYSLIDPKWRKLRLDAYKKLLS